MPYSEVVFNQGDCVTNDQVGQIFENLDYFADCGDSVSQQFKCTQIESQQQSTTIGTEVCFTIQDPTNASPSDAAVEQKLLFLDIAVDFAYGANGEEFDPNRVINEFEITVKCDGQVVETLDGCQPIQFACFDCSTLSTIEVCVNTSAGYVGFSGQVVGSATVKLCGAMACIGKIVNNGLNDYFMPQFRPNCKYDRMFVHAVLQNLRTFRAAFSEFGQIPSCRQDEFADDDDHTLLFNSPTTTEYLTLGTVTVCAQNFSTASPAYFTYTPRALCGSIEQNCNTRQFVIQPQDEGNAPAAEIECFKIPVIFCGVCAPGENLTLGFQSRLDCDGEDPAVVSGSGRGEVVSVNQEYCTFLFNRVQADFQSTIETGLDKCILLETFQNIALSMEELNEVCNDFTPINLTTRVGDGVAAEGEIVELQEALPWPPLDDPTNQEPPPVKKWWLSLNVEACFTGNIPDDNSGLQKIRAIARVLCGGVELDFDFNELDFTETFLTRPRCIPLKFQGCIDCRIDEAIEVQFESLLVFGADGQINTSNFNYDYKMICF